MKTIITALLLLTMTSNAKTLKCISKNYSGGKERLSINIDQDNNASRATIYARGQYVIKNEKLSESFNQIFNSREFSSVSRTASLNSIPNFIINIYPDNTADIEVYDEELLDLIPTNLTLRCNAFF